MRVSVVIPNRNNAEFIAECLHSVADDPAVGEILVYDDSSTDRSVERIQALAVPQLRLLRGTDRIGAHRARTEAVRAAANAIVCLLDGDDRLAPGSVGAGFAALRANDLDIAIPRMVRFREGSQPTPFIEPPSKTIDGLAAFRLTLDEWRIHPMGVMSRDLYLRAAERMQGHGYSDDELFARHLFLEARRVGGSPGTYEYRIVDKPVTPTDRLGRLRTRRAVLALALEAGIPRSELGRLTNGFVRDFIRTWPLAGRQQRDELSELAAGLPRPAPGWALQDRLLRALASLFSGRR